MIIIINWQRVSVVGVAPLSYCTMITLSVICPIYSYTPPLFIKVICTIDKTYIKTIDTHYIYPILTTSKQNKQRT